MSDVRIEQSWGTELTHEFTQEYFKNLTTFVKGEYARTNVYPPPKLLFNAFDSCPFHDVRVVILGQDPYHGKGQAHGLSFSVPQGVRIPPSLKNIFKEIHDDIGTPIPDSGNLERWAQQGVLLLNATLTVRAGEPGSHQGNGWEEFTDAVIQALSEKREHLVFMLWGKYAKAKGAHIDRDKHLVLEAAHPSPYSAHSGFFGCKHFSKANKYLVEHRIQPIDW